MQLVLVKVKIVHYTLRSRYNYDTAIFNGRYVITHSAIQYNVKECTSYEYYFGIISNPLRCLLLILYISYSFLKLNRRHFMVVGSMVHLKCYPMNKNMLILIYVHELVDKLMRKSPKSPMCI